MNEDDARAQTEPGAAERWTVDGLETTPRGPVARLERPDGTILDRPLTGLPPGLQEGDVLAVYDGPDGVTLVRLPGVTAERRAQAQAQLDALNEGGRAAVPLNDDGEVTL